MTPAALAAGARTAAADPVLSARELRTWFPVRGGLLRRVRGQVRALDGMDLDIRRGEIVGLVGESGCGKSTVGRTLLRLVEPTSGRIRWDGRDLLAMDARALKAFRARAQMIFQDPLGSLNPRMTAGGSLREPLRVHGRKERGRERAGELLRMVGLGPEYQDRYPHELSGGQRQRVAIARALAVDPHFIVADEPVSSLDVSVQAQILNLLGRLRDELDLTYLFISHDLRVIRHLCGRVLVMYLGRMVEEAGRDALFSDPLHPYTRALISAVPRVEEPRRRGRIVLGGEVPSPADPPRGCHFHTRCPHVMERCRRDYPPVVEAQGRKVACWLHM